ncbi:peptide deformylase [Parachlamydia sp. AcF125]|uniref:peptide deformylase n=1 Tax=Parachlamydia sp. AcF125 TaxID=2795736 RepID=UPI001BC8F52F|nr:peptide deformylase [Parachlamydia sp. AcF125]MBS4169167.1 Peptide deformylase [Parachlamydia sp. AcF125]
MQLPLAYYGDPILRKKCARIEQIDHQLKQLVSDMEETLEAHRGIGLAAPQVHHALNLFITKVPLKNTYEEEIPAKLRVFINPKILAYSQEKNICAEGCLSIPNLYAPVARPISISLQYTDLEGKIWIEEFKELEARCILHENDHINGVLFIDRVKKGNERKLLDPLLKQIKKQYHPKQ